jgi:hypothetical protein
MWPMAPGCPPAYCVQAAIDGGEGEVPRMWYGKMKQGNERALLKRNKMNRGGHDSFGVGGGGQGVRGWPRPGGRYTRMPDPGRGHTPPRGGQEELAVWTR